MSVTDILERAKAEGATLWADGDTVRCRWPKGIPLSVKAEMMRCKPELLAALRATPPKRVAICIGAPGSSAEAVIASLRATYGDSLTSVSVDLIH